MKVFKIVLFLLLIAACSKEAEFIPDRKDFASAEITVENVSYENYMKPLLAKNCGTCHGDGGSAEVWWKNTHTYENAVEYARAITTTINNGTMPPPPKFPFTERDRQLVLAWFNKGFPKE